MMTKSYLGAYWAARAESSVGSAERLAHFLDGIKRADNVLGDWFKKGRSEASAREPIDRDLKSLIRLLEAGRNRRDTDGSIIDDLGFGFGFWNRNKPVASVSGHVGMSAQIEGLSNAVVLSFDELQNLASAELAFHSLVEAWQPDWATWATPELAQRQHDLPGVPVVGWLTYIRDASAGASTSPRSYRLSEGTVLRTGEPLGDVSGSELAATGAMVALHYRAASGTSRTV